MTPAAGVGALHTSPEIEILLFSVESHSIRRSPQNLGVFGGHFEGHIIIIQTLLS